MTQGFAVDELGGDEVTTCFITHFINREDVWMVERRGGVGFLVEAIEAIAILRQLLGQQLKRDFAPKLRVFGEIDFAHAASAELFENSITTNVLQIHGGLTIPGHVILCAQRSSDSRRE